MGQDYESEDFPVGGADGRWYATTEDAQAAQDAADQAALQPFVDMAQGVDAGGNADRRALYGDAGYGSTTTAEPDSVGKRILDYISDRYMPGGKLDLAAITKDGLTLGAVMSAWDAAKNPPKTGYQGGIPSLTAVRKQLAGQPEGTRPGAGGHRYFTDTVYANKDNLGQVQATIDNQALGLTALNDRNAANKANTAANTPKVLTDAQKMNALYQKYRYDPVTLSNLQAQQGWSDASMADATGMSMAQFSGWKNSFAPTPTPAPTPTTTPAPASTTTPVGVPTFGGGAAASQPAPVPAPTPVVAPTPVTAQETWANGFPKQPGDLEKYGQGAFDMPTTTDGRMDTSSPAFTNFINTATPDAISDAGNQWNFNAQQTDRNAGTGAGVGSVFNNISWMPTDTYAGYAAQYNAGKASQDPTWAMTSGSAPMLTEAAYNAQNGRAAADAASGVSFGGGAPAAPQANNYFISPSTGNMVTWDANGTHTDTGQKPPGMAAGGLTALAKGGAAHNPRYLRGETDGMADEIPAQIDGHQPAALAHGEFVIPADVVSHLGNGNSDAGAKQLYKMMDKIRMARTGRKSQGKEINPEKFTVGGQAYAAGGEVQHFETGGVPTGTTGTESNLSNWVGPYVTGMLGKGQALSETPYAAYDGQLSAGDSALQTQAYGNAANLNVPGSIGAATQTAGQVGNKMGGLGYNAGTQNSAYTAPGATGYNAQNAQAATGAYNPGLQNYQMGPASQVASQNFTAPGAAQEYMSPYMQNVVGVQQREAQRAADIASSGRHAAQGQQGSFGGSRGAIMDSEAARNLATQKGDIQAQGSQAAFNNAQQQFNADQGRSMAAQQANQSAGLTVGQQNLGANMQTQALGAGIGSQWGLQNLSNQQQSGLANQTAVNQAAQFGITSGMQNAGQAAQYGLAANNANTADRQFGANYGLQALQGQLSAANTHGQLGVQQNQANLANIGLQSQLGNQQQNTTQAGVAADQNAFNQERDNPFKMVQFQQSLLQGLPLAAQSYNTTTNPWNAALSAAGAIQSAPVK